MNQRLVSIEARVVLSLDGRVRSGYPKVVVRLDKLLVQQKSVACRFCSAIHLFVQLLGTTDVQERCSVFGPCCRSACSADFWKDSVIEL